MCVGVPTLSPAPCIPSTSLLALHFIPARPPNWPPLMTPRSLWPASLHLPPPPLLIAVSRTCGSGFCSARNLAMALCFSSTAASVWLGTNSTMPLSVPVAITLYGVSRRSRLSLRAPCPPRPASVRERSCLATADGIPKHRVSEHPAGRVSTPADPSRVGWPVGFFGTAIHCGLKRNWAQIRFKRRSYCSLPV
jgi:hypothetical protein